MEILGETFLDEETLGGGEVEFAVCDTTISEEVDGEDGFGKGGKVARGGKVELRVCGEGLGDTLGAESVCGGEVVKSSSVCVAVFDELLHR